ncbi:zf-CCHC domain-containing protein [Tanacetum coccineum]
MFEANDFIYWKNRFETYVKSKDIDLWHIIIDGDYKPTGRDECVPYEQQSDKHKKMLSKNNEAKMVLYNILPKKEYERVFMHKTVKDIWNFLVITHQDDESTDSAFARFNNIITSLNALDESSSSQNYSRKFLRAHPTKWRRKKAILKVKDDKKEKGEIKCFRCGNPNHFVGDCPKRPQRDQKAFVGGSWSDSEEEKELKKDKICLMAHDFNEVHSDSLYYSSSSLDDESLQIELTNYAKLALRSLIKQAFEN